MNTLRWIVLMMGILVSSHGKAQLNADCDPVHPDSIRLGWRPIFEIPGFIFPFTRADLLFPVGNSRDSAPYVGIGGGNYVVYPSKKLKVGFLVGFSYGEYQERLFSGDYIYEGGLQPLAIWMHSRLRNFRYGIKIIDYNSRQKFKPYLELYAARVTMFTRLQIDKPPIDESTPMIESRYGMLNHTRAFHANVGIEWMLVSLCHPYYENYLGGGLFLHLGIGYLHGENPIRHLDIRNNTSDLSSITDADLNYYLVNSSKTDFSRYVLILESQLRYFNLSMGLTIRL